MSTPNLTKKTLSQQIDLALAALKLAMTAFALADHPIPSATDYEAIGVQALAQGLYLMPPELRTEALARFRAGAGR